MGWMARTRHGLVFTLLLAGGSGGALAQSPPTENLPETTPAAPATPAIVSRPAPALPVVRLTPEVQVTGAVRQESLISDRQEKMIRYFMDQHLLIMPEEITGKGYIIGEPDNRTALSMGDRVLLNFEEPVTVGESLAVYRPDVKLEDPINQEMKGVLAIHLGTVQVEQITAEGPLAVITRTFQDITPGDRLMHPVEINNAFTVHSQAQDAMSGRVLHIYGKQDEGGSQQVVAVGVGRRERAVQGLVLQVFRTGRELEDPVSGKKVTMPSQKSGDVILFYVGEKASFGLLNKVTYPVHVGDTVSAH